MGSPQHPDLIRLTLPAQADFVSVLRVAVRVVATRAGLGDDARSRLQATAGTAFFALIGGAGSDSSMEVSLRMAPGAVTVDLAGPGAVPPSLAQQLDVTADPHVVLDDGRTVRMTAPS